MKKLTKREIARIRAGADLIAKDTPKVVGEDYIHAVTPYACEAIGFGYLATRLYDFYQPPHPDLDDVRWGDLPYGRDFTTESQLQRELMLELFAHLEGVV